MTAVPAAAEDTVKIGFAGPMTGPLSAFGTVRSRADKARAIHFHSTTSKQAGRRLNDDEDENENENEQHKKI